MRYFSHALTCWLACATVGYAVAQAPTGPTVQDVVEFKRIVQPQNHSADALREQVSPDGTRVFIVTRKADVATDKNRYEIQLLHLAPDRPVDRRAPAPETVFAFDAAEDGDYHHPALQDVRWWDDRTLIFMARLQGPRPQVYRLDLPKRELVQLTHEANPIVSYEASRNMRRLVYAVQLPNPPLQDAARSVTVGNQSFWSIKFGQQDLRAQNRKYRFFVADLASASPPRPLGGPFLEGNSAVPRVSISPDGRWALLPRYEAARTPAWERLYPMVAELTRRFDHSRSADPLSYFSRPLSYVARRMTAWKLDVAQEQTVLDAPDDALPSGGQDRTDRIWLGTGTSVVLAGTHLPPGQDGKVATASHVIEYWPDTGRWQVIARLTGRLEEAHPLPEGFVVVDAGQRREFMRGPGGLWRETPAGTAPEQPRRLTWSLSVSEGLNQPPDIVATRPSGNTLRLTNLNPQFDPTRWGTMRPYAWRDARGRRWRGGLMTPSGASARQGRLPLVIQTYGFSPDRFYLDGPNVADGITSGFAGRAFLREGILVLDMPWRPVDGTVTEEWQAIQRFNEGVLGAVDTLVKEGRVDPGRVGIIGWSATGERVLNLITFSKLPVRAASLVDGDANTLFSMAVTYGANDAMWKRKESINRGLPFGKGLAGWVRNDPALHTDCIKAALRIETYGPWVLNNWDLYALLRRQYKPVEMVVIPGGAHALSKPSERMISLQGNVDWYRFWLNGEQRTATLWPSETVESLREQYAAWLQMRQLKNADDAKPRCARVAAFGS